MGTARDLTHKLIERTPRPSTGQIFLRDRQVRGLALRITAKDHRTWVFEARIHRRNRRFALGTWPATPLVTARKAAIDARARIDRGENPADDRERERATPTFGDLSRAWLERHAKDHKKSWEEDDRRLQRHFGSWSARRLDDISSADVERRLREIASRSGRYESNRSLALLRVMFNHAIRWKMRPSGSNPCTDLKPYKEQARSRYLVPDELRRVLTALDGEADPFWQAYFKIALLLGPRRSELLSAEWRHVHFDTDPPTIEFPTTKAGRAHTLPLPAPVVEILKSIPKLDDSPFVFPGRGASGHLVEPKKAWNRIRKGAGVSDIRVHDLRRTLGSWLASSGYGLPLVGKILNHTNPSTTQVYARVDLAPVKAALDANAERMLSVLG